MSEFADPTKIVYRGHGSYTGLWEVLCAESRQVPGRPEVFMWGENELLQAKTKKLVLEPLYRGTTIRPPPFSASLF